MAPDIKVTPVSTGSDLKTFLTLPWKLYQGDKCWVPPMLFDVKNRISPGHNPYFEHAQATYFIARRGTEPVGRISAQIDRHYDEHWGGKTGHFGFFESIDDPAAAKALFGAAADWLARNGRDKIQGPYNLNINDECGLLVEGFDSPPMTLMTYNHQYYIKLIEDLGFAKAMDLLSYRLDATADAPEDVKNYAEMIREKEGVVIREWDMSNFKREMDMFREVYNSAWEQNWGMVKLTEKELKAHSFELRWLLESRLAFFAEKRGGEVMGVSLTLPNLNEYLAKLNGHLYNALPTLWYRMAVKKKYRSCRVFALGVKKEFRKSGVGAVFYYDTLMAAKRLGYEWGDMGWILETNDNMNRAILHMGGKVYKRYRIFEKPL